MSTAAMPYHSAFTERYKAEGKAEGKADSLLNVLAARGLEISDDTRRRIESCTDSQQLDDWIKQAVVITNTDELFD